MGREPLWQLPCWIQLLVNWRLIFPGAGGAPTNVTIVRVSYRLAEVAKPKPFLEDCLLGGFVGAHSESRDR